MFTTLESPKYSNLNSPNLLLCFFCLIKSRANCSGITQPFLNPNLIFFSNVPQIVCCRIIKKHQNKDLENLNILKVLVSRTSYLRHVIDEVTKASSEAVKSVTLPMWKSIFISTIISNCWILPIEFEWRLTFFSFQLALCTFSTPQPTIVAIWTTLAVVTQAKPNWNQSYLTQVL